jgi:hypothetical protein
MGTFLVSVHTLNPDFPESPHHDELQCFAIYNNTDGELYDFIRGRSASIHYLGEAFILYEIAVEVESEIHLLRWIDETKWKDFLEYFRAGMQAKFGENLWAQVYEKCKRESERFHNERYRADETFPGLEYYPEDAVGLTDFMELLEKKLIEQKQKKGGERTYISDEEIIESAARKVYEKWKAEGNSLVIE